MSETRGEQVHLIREKAGEEWTEPWSRRIQPGHVAGPWRELTEGTTVHAGLEQATATIPPPGSVCVVLTRAEAIQMASALGVHVRPVYHTVGIAFEVDGWIDACNDALLSTKEERGDG